MIPPLPFKIQQVLQYCPYYRHQRHSVIPSLNNLSPNTLNYINIIYIYKRVPNLILNLIGSLNIKFVPRPIKYRLNLFLDLKFNLKLNLNLILPWIKFEQGTYNTPNYHRSKNS